MPKGKEKPIEAEVVDATPAQEAQVPSSTSLAVIEDVPLAPIIGIKDALEAWDAFQQVVKERMKQGQHYDTIPGAERPSLLDPGADLIMKLYGLTDVHPTDPIAYPSYVIERVTEEWHEEPPLFDYVIRCYLYAARSGRCVRTALASCSSWEDKYRWRESRRKCPKCGQEAIIKGKEEFGGGWLCWAKKGGCGAKYPDGSQAIESQKVGREPNMDVVNQKNTILQMAQKRAKVRAVRGSTLAGEMFTQDMEEIAGEHSEREAKPLDRQQAKGTAVQTAGAKWQEAESYIVRGIVESAERRQTKGKQGKPGRPYATVVIKGVIYYCFDDKKLDGESWLSLLESSVRSDVSFKCQKSGEGDKWYYKITELLNLSKPEPPPHGDKGTDEPLTSGATDDDIITFNQPSPAAAAEARDERPAAQDTGRDTFKLGREAQPPASLPLKTFHQDAILRVAKECGYLEQGGKPLGELLSARYKGVLSLTQLPNDMKVITELITYMGANRRKK